MKIVKTVIALSFLNILSLFLAGQVYPLEEDMRAKMEVDEELDQELKWLKAETFVFTASKVMENIKKAPSSITVITDFGLIYKMKKSLRFVYKTYPLSSGFCPGGCPMELHPKKDSFLLTGHSQLCMRVVMKLME